MLIGLGIRDVVLIESLDLAIGPGLTALTGETGAGKSIILDALGLASGARAESGLVRRGAVQASASAVFAPAPDHAVWAVLEEKGLSYARDEDLVLRRTLSADGRSRAFINDQAASASALKEISSLLLEVHGQHETVGLLDWKTHRPQLDAFGGIDAKPVSAAWEAWRAARAATAQLEADQGKAAAEVEELTLRLAELDRLDPQADEEQKLSEERALLGSAEKTLADIQAARDAFGGNKLMSALSGSMRALERARERALMAGAAPEGHAVARLTAACEALDRAQIEAAEAAAAIATAQAAFDFRPDELEKTEERLFALRAMARKLGALVQDLPSLRVKFAQRLSAVEGGEDALRAARAAESAARMTYLNASAQLTAQRKAAGEALTVAVQGELAPLKLDKARFRVAVEPLSEDRAGPSGADRVAFEVSTNPGAPFGELGAIASGGELARLALALKASLAARGADQPLMIFDEVDQGVGGAVADAVGSRLKRLAANAQVLVVTHSPQVAARADQHWKVAKAGDGDRLRTAVDVLSAAEQEEEIARMLSGAEVTEAARAAARVLLRA